MHKKMISLIDIMSKPTDDGFILVSKKKLKKKEINEEPRNTYINVNQKKILCKKIIETGLCKYGKECTFAHSLSEQNIEPLRKRAYLIITSKNSLCDIDLIHDRDLYSTLCRLTRTCYRCENRTCLGGYNCKNGAIDVQHTICHEDMVFGKCPKKSSCNKVHLTERNLIPFNVQNLIYNGYTCNKNEYINTLINHIPKTIDIQTIIKYEQEQHDLDSFDSLSEDNISNNSCGEYIITLLPNHAITEN